MFRRMKVIFLLVILGLIILFVLNTPTFLRFNFRSLENVIVVDAGHGRSDPGTIGFSGSYEKDIKSKEKPLDAEGCLIV